MRLKSYTLVRYNKVEILVLESFKSNEKTTSISWDDKYMYTITYKEDRQVFERKDRRDVIKEVKT